MKLKVENGLGPAALRRDGLPALIDARPECVEIEFSHSALALEHVCILLARLSLL
jgi:hypothetical protein